MLVRRHPLFLLFMAIMMSCGNPQQDIPSYVLSPDRFAQVLVNYALAESAAGVNVKSVNAGQLDSVYSFDPLKDSDVTKAQYDSSLRFYSLHPELYKKVYEDVLNRLSVMESARDGVKADSAAK
jgi:hypothetical protein